MSEPRELLVGLLDYIKEQAKVTCTHETSVHGELERIH